MWSTGSSQLSSGCSHRTVDSSCQSSDCVLTSFQVGSDSQLLTHHMMYDTDQCRTHFNSLLGLCVGVGGRGGWGGGLSIWCFVWVVLVGLCSTCV